MAGPAMDQLARDVADHGVSSVFVYTREAHPAEHYGAHDSWETKLHHARALRDELGVQRLILVDSLDGACHRAWGMLPNMSWIVGRRGTIVYKADWTDTSDIREAIELLIGAREFRGDKVPFYSERQAYRDVDREAFFKGLERNGPKAIEDFTR